MAKSLEELRLAFKAQYPKQEDDKQEEPVELESQDDIKEDQAKSKQIDADEESEPIEVAEEPVGEPEAEEEPELIEASEVAVEPELRDKPEVIEKSELAEEPESIESPEAAEGAESVEELEEAEGPIGEPEAAELTEALELIAEIETTKEYTIDTTIVDEIQKQKATEVEEEKSKRDKKRADEIEKAEEKLKAAQQEVEAEMAALKEKKQNRALIISDIFFYGTLILMVVFALLFSRGAFGSQTLGDYRFYEVLTTSMESVYPRGSLIIIKQTDPSELLAGDDIAFTNANNDLITHRVIEIEENHEGGGKRAFVTKGVDNAVADKDVVLATNVVGKVVKGIPGLGATFKWLGENLWVVVALFLSLVALSFFLKKLWGENRRSLKEGPKEEKLGKQQADSNKKEGLFSPKRRDK